MLIQIEQLLGQTCSHNWRKAIAATSFSLVQIGEGLGELKGKTVLNNKCWRCPTNSSYENSLQMYHPNEGNELWVTGLWRLKSNPCNNSDIVGKVCTEIPKTSKLLGNIPSQALANPNHKWIPVYLLDVSERGR